MSTLKPMIQKAGNSVILKREQWKNHSAKISDYPGLLDEVMKYTWTYQEGRHPYLRCIKLGVSLHRFVLDFLYGKEQVDHMLEQDNIIEHLDNDGLNCTYDNLHILSEDYNKAKAFTIDKERASEPTIPSFVTGVFYSHEKRFYQMQVFFNRNIFYNLSNGQPIEELYFIYHDFRALYVDWVYIYGCRQRGVFALNTLHKDQWYAKLRPVLYLNEDEKDYVCVQRDGILYMRLNPYEGEKMAVALDTAYRKIDI